jgi:hypothetical protein
MTCPEQSQFSARVEGKGVVSHPAVQPPYESETRGDEPDLYEKALSPEDAAIYRAASSGAELEKEIRIIRVVLTRLAEDPARNHAHISRALATLCRLLQLQSKQEEGGSDVERRLLDISRSVLADLEQMGAGGQPPYRSEAEIAAGRSAHGTS